MPFLALVLPAARASLEFASAAVRTPAGAALIAFGTAWLSGQSLDSYRYFYSGREQFADGVRRYLADPSGFKASYPDAAKFLRDAINSNPEIRKILMLSQADPGSALA
ncbi:hypothetical protein IY145_05060 [Methylosinus sp. H3A]|uniref:hypothetical protein n=1 Tax=Methylosinus sp. H3A TaxID=2785786 RepID=UPI0018C2158C|nr:hypothetical protein [Methylosinus sp. H3A]MBG0808740.1 hypothetical protein [Methylosinus sp. H3A]